MKKNSTLLLVCLLIFSAISPGIQAANSSTCLNGECVPGLIVKLEELGKVYEKECLPKGIKNSEIENHHLENGLTEPCWQYITEINHLESELLKHQNRLEARLGCEGKDCNLPSPSESLNSQISALSKVEKNLSCNETKKQQIKNSCGSDMNCVFISSALGIGGYAAELLIPEKSKPKNCHLGNDSCATQLATGFIRAAITFFKGAWDLLKMGANKAKKEMKKFWGWVSGAEDHSSTSQLALVKASENESFFDALMNDFPGTMKKIWSAFIASLKEWLKSRVFCQKWSGVPQFSQCLQPTESFDCIPCKTMATGLCSVAGTIVAEVVPAFLTGGILTAAKHGVNGASKISKLFKVSSSGMKAVKSSQVGKVAAQNSGKIDDVLKATRGLQKARAAVQVALSAIKKYLISPTRKLLKTSFTVMGKAIEKGTPHLAETPVGKVLHFSADAAKKTLKVILYPIDNPMTVFAYKKGIRTFDKVLSLGAPRLGSKTIVTSSIIQKNAHLEPVLAKLEKAKMGLNPNGADILKLEEELLTKVEGYRKDILKSALANKNGDLSDIIKNLYPELQYGALAKKLPKEKVLAAEKELYLEIQRLPAGAEKDLWLKRYQAHVAYGQQRASVLGGAKHPFDPETKVPLEKTAAQDNFNKPLTPEELAAKSALDSYTDFSQREILDEAVKTEQLIKTSSKPVVYDVVAIGAGPNNGVAVSVLKEMNPKLNVLVIEATESMGTFNKIKGFDVNTPEFIGNSGNNFPGTPVQLKDFNFNDASFARAEDLGDLTVSTYKSADADMIFNNRVIKWEKEPSPGAWPAKYKVETSNGVTVYTNAGLAGTGFGPAITRLKDPDSIALVARYEEELSKVDVLKDATYVPKATSVDEFLTIASRDVIVGRQAMSRYKGKKVLVVGSGDGGNIAVEGTTGLNKYLNPNELDTGVETIWLGQSSATGKEFLESMSTRKHLRYSRIAKEMDSGKIKPVNGYLARVEEFVNEAGETQFKAYYTTKDGKAISEPLIVDNLVFATGYPNDHSTLAPIFKSMTKNGNAKGDEVVFESVQGRVDDYTPYEEFKTTSEITKQVVINGNAEDIYATGVFAKTPISDEEWKIPTGGFLDITAPKAAATGELVAQKLAPQSVSKKQMHTLLKVRTGGKFEFIKSPLRSGNSTPDLNSVLIADIFTKVEIGKTLRAFKTKPNSGFNVSIQKGLNGKYVYKVSGLEKKAAEKIARALSQNAKLTHGIDGQFKLGRTQIDLGVVTRSTGTINVEKLQFTPITVAVAQPIIVPMAIGKGLSKFTSPSLKTAGNKNNENEIEEEKSEE